jgi:ribosomal protein S18 acetylase RimI-like enzyme
MEENSSPISLRPATSEDESFLVCLYASTRASELAALPWDDNQKQAFINMQCIAQCRQYVMSYPRADSKIVLSNDEPVGRLLVDRGEDALTLIDISLLPAYRKLGIGTQLLQGLLDEANTAGKPVRLHVLHSNPAKKLYQRLGFSMASSDEVYCEMVWSRADSPDISVKPQDLKDES